MKKKIKKITKLLIISSFFLLTNCQTEESITTKKSIENTNQNKRVVNYVSLNMLPSVKNIVREIKTTKKNQNKSINSFDLDEEKILELIKENGDKSYSLLIEKAINENEPYTVENLNILSQNGEYKVLFTKWIPVDGQPFYDVSKFIGELQYLDLNGNLLHSLKLGTSTTTSKSQFVIAVGCWDYDIISCGCADSHYQIVSSSNHCGMYGGSTTGGTTTGGVSGTGTATTTGGGGGAGYTGSGTTSFVPNIPTQDVVEAKMYNTFLTSLTTDQYNFLGYYKNVNQDIFNYLSTNNFVSANKLIAKKMINASFISNYLGTNATTEFVDWGSNYLIKNSTVTWKQFINWFMGFSEGQDGTYDATYWENPNLTFQKQNLPTMNNFMNAYPKNADGTTYMVGKDLYPFVGGAVYQAYLDYPSVVR